MTPRPFIYGWGMVAIAAVIPIMYSLAASLSIEGMSFVEISEHIILRSSEDMSFIFLYFCFGAMHIFMCIAGTYYIYDIARNSSSIFIFKKYYTNHIAAFVSVSIIFMIIALSSEMSMKRLSSDLLWIGLSHVSSKNILFHTIFQIRWPFLVLDIKIFNVVPVALTVAAFLPASAIMMVIPHLVAKLDVDIKLTPEDIISSFLDRFDIVYYLMVFLLISSSIAAHLYLQTPYIIVDSKASNQYVHLINSVFAMWCMVFFLVLFSTLLVSYYLVVRKIKKESENIELIIDAKRFADIKRIVNIHFIIKRKSALFASSFSPLVVLIIKNSIN